MGEPARLGQRRAEFGTKLADGFGLGNIRRLQIAMQPVHQKERKRTPNPMVFVLQLGVVGVRDDIHSE